MILLENDIREDSSSIFIKVNSSLGIKVSIPHAIHCKKIIMRGEGEARGHGQKREP